MLRYIKSLKKLGEIARLHSDLLVLPAHRLFYNGHWNSLNLADRVNELLEHHIQRCAAIIEILNTEPRTADEIAQEHFEERLLEGFGSLMAANEVVSHCELLIHSGDVAVVDNGMYTAKGSANFEADIRALKSDY